MSDLDKYSREEVNGSDSEEENELPKSRDPRSISLGPSSQYLGEGEENEAEKSVDNNLKYRSKRGIMPLSPNRGDAFSGATPARSYRDIMITEEMKKEEIAIRKEIADKVKVASDSVVGRDEVVVEKKRRRWDETSETPVRPSGWDSEVTATPLVSGDNKLSSRWDVTPMVAAAIPKVAKSRWDETPSDKSVVGDATPQGTKKRSRWDETPQVGSKAGGGGDFMTPAATPIGSAAYGMMTPSASAYGMTPEMAQQQRWEAEVDERNRPMSDAELDALFPPGYKVLDPPPSYVPLRTPSRKLLATPTPMAGTPGFAILATPARESYAVPPTPGESALPYIKPEDYQYFGKLMDEGGDEEALPEEEQKERKIMRLLLKIKNGTPPQRKTALRHITDKSKDFGAENLFNQILPLLMSPTLEDQERHLLVKVIDRILYKLGDLVRPFVHKILVVIEPLLIDEDYFARVEGREIISNLAKAAGLASMISTMRPDIDNPDEYVRNTTARAFAVVASALGIPALLPFLKAVCQSKKSWQARHTGIKIVQQIAILMGAAILPHLKMMVTIAEQGLVDEQQKVRTITALALAALAEAAFPYGIEAFDSVLRPLFKGILMHRGKGLAAFLKAIGYIIPLMDSSYAKYYTKEVISSYFSDLHIYYLNTPPYNTHTYTYT